MADDPRPVKIGIDDREAIKFLKKLAKNEHGERDELEADPKKALKKHLKIDLHDTRGTVTLPSPSTLQKYVDDLEAEQAKGDAGKYAKLAHGIVLLYVAHGNGLPSP
jgi:hypothetical protein